MKEQVLTYYNGPAVVSFLHLVGVSFFLVVDFRLCRTIPGRTVMTEVCP
jgi:hypothetical protein